MSDDFDIYKIFSSTYLVGPLMFICRSKLDYMCMRLLFTIIIFESFYIPADSIPTNFCKRIIVKILKCHRRSSDITLDF